MRHSRKVLSRHPGTMTSGETGASATTRTAAAASADHLVSLQRTIGNQAVQRLVKNSTISLATPRIQRSGWWDTLTETIGGALETAGDVAGSLWDAIMGEDKGKEKSKSKPQRPSTPDDSLEYEVTDSDARIRTPPPDLDDTAYAGMIIPKGTIVKIVNKHRKGGKWYVEVELVSPSFALPSGWTVYNNLSLGGSTPEPDKPADEGEKSLEDELKDIAKLKPAAYKDKEGDQAIRDQVIELANSDDNKHNSALTAELALYGLTPEKWFANLYPSATFLGVSIKGSQNFAKKKLSGIHQELYERLQVAEQILTAETGLDPTALGKEFQIKGIGGLREVEPATGSAKGVGLHSYGLAIDIGTKSGPNPLLTENTKWKNPETKKTEVVKTANAAVIDRAARFVKLGLSEQFGVGEKASKGTGSSSLEKRVTQADQWWDVMHDASEALKVYLQFESATEVEVGGQKFKLEELAAAYGRESGDVRSASEWQEQIRIDRENLTGDLAKTPDKGFLNLDKRLVMALVKAGLSWGGTLDNSKDIHHFGLYDGTIKKSKVSSNA